MKEILLTQGKVALVSDEDYEYLNQWKWHLIAHGYAARNIRNSDGRKTKVYMHHALIGKPEKGLEIDHKNGNKSDNRRENLRECTHAKNMANTKLRKDNTSGYKGVSYITRLKKWTAKICDNKKDKYLGLFTNPESAARAYDKASKKLHSGFARTNF